MTSQTYVTIARQKDAADGIDPWSFQPDNPGYKWLLERQEAFLDEDSERDPTVASESVSAGPVSSSQTFKTGQGVSSRVDIITAAIEMYMSGLTSLPTRTRGVFGFSRP